MRDVRGGDNRSRSGYDVSGGWALNGRLGLDGSWSVGGARSCEIWANERFTGAGKPTMQFEEILHEFAQTIEVAGNAGAVEAELMRQARRMVPGCRLELITGPALPDDQGPPGADA